MMFELRMLGYRFLKAFMKPVVKLVPQPRPVVFVGPDAALRLCSMIGGFGFRRVLIVTDAVLVKLGVVAPLRRALVEQGIDVRCSIRSCPTRLIQSSNRDTPRRSRIGARRSSPWAAAHRSMPPR